jgi:hypothetical protein
LLLPARWPGDFVMRLCVFSVLAALALVGCSDNTPSKRFETKGLVPPSTACNSDPTRFDGVTRVSDIDLGNGCFVHNAYKVNAIAGVTFNQTATMNCGVANTTATWLDQVVQPAAQDAFGERVVEISVPSAFSCRPRNNQRGGKLSEHGMGNAIDVSAFTLESGRKITVEQGWFGSRDSKSFLQQVRSEACGPFKTVLGPGSDAHHDDHLHLDLQRHRSGGSYCR